MRFKRSLSMLLAVCMLMGLIPVTAKAAEESTTDSELTATGDLVLNKTAVLEDDGSYTIQLEAYATGTPVRTQVKTGRPLQIVIAVDQSGSMVENLDTVKDAITKFVEIIAANGRSFEVEHHVAIVGFASNETDGQSTGTTGATIAGGSEDEWVNTGVFDSQGNFQNYITGTAAYTLHEGELVEGAHHHYAKLSDGTYSEMQYHEEVYCPIQHPQAGDTDLYYYVDGQYKPVTHDDTFEDKYVLLEDNNTMKQNKVYYVDLEEQKVAIEYGTCYRATTYTPKESVFGSGTAYQDGDVLYVVDQNGNEKKLTCEQSGWFLGYTYTWTDETGSTYSLNKGDTVYTQTKGWHYADSHLLLDITDTTPVYKWITRWTYEGDNGATEEVPEDAQLYQHGQDVWTYETESGHMVIWTNEKVYTKVGGELNKADYRDALMPVSNGENGQGEITSALLTSIEKLSASGATRISHGLEIADKIFESNHGSITEGKHGHVVVVFTDGQPGHSGFETDEANAALASANHMKTSISEGGYEAEIYTVGLLNNLNSSTDLTQTEQFLSGVSSNYQGVTTMTELSGATAQATKYFREAADLTDLNDIFTNITIDSTTTSTTVTLGADSIMRDILGTGMELMPGATVSAMLVPGEQPSEGADIVWDEASAQPLDVNNPTLELGNVKEEFDSFANEETAKIKVYNINENTGANVGQYHPHTIDIEGFNYCGEYISVGNPGKKLVVTITGIEESPLAVWNQTLYTNNDYSGIWSPMDSETGERTLEASFIQPATLLTSHNYVVDYAKTFVMDLEADIHMTDVQHLDEDDTNRFDTENKVTYLSEKYGNVRIEGNKIYYHAKNINWDGYDTFYVFGKTKAEDVLMHSANAAKSNLWSRINVLPANNVYYEDDFVTTEDGDVGIQYSGSWTEVCADGSGQNGETAGSDADGWIGSMTDDVGDTDGTSHKATTVGATATFTFTGTAVDVYSRTSVESGIIIALLYEGASITDENGKTKPAKKGVMIDTLSASSKENGEYYHIPTLSFSHLTYGTYTVKIMVNKASAHATGTERLLYQLDGIRVYNPLQGIENTGTNSYINVNDAYGKEEANAEFEEIRNCLIDEGSYGEYGDTKGAVFIDKIGDRKNYTESQDIVDFSDYGSKNETYLAPNQMITFAVDYDENAYYYLGIKSITGKETSVTYRYDGQTTKQTICHTADMYYEITPYWQDTDSDGVYDTGLVAVANTGSSIIALTKLKVTNRTQIVMKMSLFARMPRQQMVAYATGLDMNEPEEEIVSPGEEDTIDNQETTVPMLDEISDKLFAGVYDMFV